MANIHTPFFDFFPKTKYDINRSQYPVYEDVTNIFFRLTVLKNILNNTSSYYVYEIDGNDTPEIVAEKIYGDSGAGWIVIYANQILDPQFDWVLDDNTFNRYIAAKYGSVATAQTTPHHYEKVIERTVDGITTTSIFQIDRQKLTVQDSDVPYDYYSDFFRKFTVDSDEYTADSTTVTADIENYIDLVPVNPNIDVGITYFNTYNVDGKTIHETIIARPVTAYDYEASLNDSRRQIKVIKKEYYTKIIQEFRNLVGTKPSYIRTVS